MNLTRKTFLGFIFLVLLPLAAAQQVQFAVIGDYGVDNEHQEEVADLVENHFFANFVVTTGDNSYIGGGSGGHDYETAVGKYYEKYVNAVQFWPSLGNHDDPDGAADYLDYFYYLPGNKLYYDVDYGLVHLFILASFQADKEEQKRWLEEAAAASNACFKIVAYHVPPYSTGEYSGTSAMRAGWDYDEWGVDIVLSGHDHNYQHFAIDADADGNPVHYMVNGLGGHSNIYGWETDGGPELIHRYNDGHGAQLMVVNSQGLTTAFYDTSAPDVEIDQLTIQRDCGGQQVNLNPSSPGVGLASYGGGETVNDPNPQPLGSSVVNSEDDTEEESISDDVEASSSISYSGCSSEQSCEKIDSAWFAFATRAGFTRASEVWDHHARRWVQRTGVFLEGYFGNDDTTSDEMTIQPYGNSFDIAGSTAHCIAFLDDPLKNAFLDMLAWAEGAAPSYSIMFGGETFNDHSAHPVDTREMPQEGIPYNNGQSFSTAAGRYQFLYNTYTSLRDQGYFSSGFIPAEQDRAAWYLVEQEGITTSDLANVLSSSDMIEVIDKAANIWASLPYSSDPCPNSQCHTDECVNVVTGDQCGFGHSFYGQGQGKLINDLLTVFSTCYDYYTSTDADDRILVSYTGNSYAEPIESTPVTSSDAEVIAQLDRGSTRDETRFIVLHDGGRYSFRSMISDWAGRDSSVSTNYHIDCDGTLRAVVPEEVTAYHAGCGADASNCYLPGINSKSIGVDLRNCERDFGSYTMDAQYVTLNSFLDDVLAKYPGIKRDDDHIIAHFEVGRHNDPEEPFEWSRIGLTNHRENGYCCRHPSELGCSKYIDNAGSDWSCLANA